MRRYRRGGTASRELDPEAARGDQALRGHAPLGRRARFYLRAGKRLGKRVTEIVIFKRSAHVPAGAPTSESARTLVIRVSRTGA